MNKLIEYAEYASTMTPKVVADEIQILSRRLQFICASFSAYDDDVEELLFYLSDVCTTEKVLNQLCSLYGSAGA
ncbi:MAG: hypothetical protein EBQ73_00170 [Gammaproteobacteria bacterium]|nr:hypothetical protein [Gammaproteobacteria bacterium]